MDALSNAYRAHPKTLLFSTAALLRLLLALTFPQLPDLLTARVEISTPVSSFKTCMYRWMDREASQAVLAKEVEGRS
jgi:phosphatidylinositol glycan class U